MINPIEIGKITQETGSTTKSLEYIIKEEVDEENYDCMLVYDVCEHVIDNPEEVTKVLEGKTDYNLDTYKEAARTLVKLYFYDKNAFLEIIKNTLKETV